MITRITSKDNPALKHFRQLQVRKYRQRHGEFVLEGPVVIREALEQGTRMSMALCTDDFRETKEGRALIRQVEEEGVPLYCTEEGLFASAAGTPTPQGILAAARIPVWDRELLEEPGACFLVLDRVQDPGNIGTMVRTAEAAGVHGVILPKRRSASLTQTVFKTSAGAASWIPVARVGNLATEMIALKKHGIWFYGADMNGVPASQTDLTGASGLVIGSEGFGLSAPVTAQCDAVISLPMFGKVNSLNASVAAGILMYEAVRQRVS